MRSTEERRAGIRPGRTLPVVLLGGALIVISLQLVRPTDSVHGLPAGRPQDAPVTWDGGWSDIRPSGAAPRDEVPTFALQPREALTMPASVPVRVRIDAIGVDATLIGLGLQHDGTLAVPRGGSLLGWYAGGPSPGSLGPAVIVGHVDWGGEPGVFSALGSVSAGDEILVDREDGSRAVFRVNFVVQVPKEAFPTRLVYGDSDHAGLRLITCGGEFDRAAASYRDNLIVFAELISSD